MTTPTSNPPPRASAGQGEAGRATTVANGPSVEAVPRANGAAAGGVAAPPAPTPTAAPAGAPGRADAAAQRAHAPSRAGRPGPDLETVPRRARSKRKRLFLLFPILLIAIGAATLLGYRYWYE